jgi:hypothetical protein
MYRSAARAIPHPNPSAELEFVNDTTVTVIITNASVRDVWSLQAIANSRPEKKSSTPSSPIGYWAKSCTRDEPRTRLRSIFADPRKTTAAPVFAPNLY